MLGSPTEERYPLQFSLTDDVRAMMLKKERERYQVPTAPIYVTTVQYSKIYYKKTYYVGHGTYGPLSTYVYPGR